MSVRTRLSPTAARSGVLVGVLVGTAACMSACTSTSSDSTTLDTSDMFSEDELEQTPDTSSAQALTLTSGSSTTITAAGLYQLSGDVEDVTVVVDTDNEAAVQLILDGVSITNSDAPAILVNAADKVLITTTADSENHLEVTGAFADSDSGADAVIFSADDVVLNGTGSLEIVSAAGEGVVSHDDLKVTGGTLTISSAEDGLDAHVSIRVADGTLTIDADKDALHCGDNDDDSLGYIYVAGGNFVLNAGDDGVRATTIAQFDGGTFDITANEGIESTFIQVNDGDITLAASNDGINAAAKSSTQNVAIEVNGGTLDLTIGSGDTDGFDSNGDLTITGGTINVDAQHPFDADGTVTFTGGTVTVNGEVITEIVITGP